MPSSLRPGSPLRRRTVLTALAGMAASACAFPLGQAAPIEAAAAEGAAEPGAAGPSDAESAIATPGAGNEAAGSPAAAAAGQPQPAAGAAAEPEAMAPADVMASLPLPGLAVDVAYREPYAYIAAQNGGVHLVEVVRDDAPVHIGTLEGRADFVTVDAGWLLTLDVDGKQPLRAWNIEMPQLPVEVPVEPGVQASKFSTVSAENGLAVVSGGTAPMTVLDTSDPRYLTIQAQIDKPFGFAAARVRDGRAYLSSEIAGDGRWGVVIYDLADPANPRLIDSVRVPNGAGVSRVRSAGHFDVSVDVIGDVLFATGDGAVYAADIADPGDVSEIAMLPAPTDVVWVERSGDRLVVAGLDVGVIDVTDPAKPQPLFQLTTPGQARSAVLARDRLYIADGDAGLTVARINQPLE